MIADTRDHATALGAAMDGAELANHIVVADFDDRGLALVFEVLGCRTNRRELENVVARPDRRVAFDHRVRADDSVGADTHMGTDHRARPDLDRRIEMRAAIDHRRRMNLAGYDNFSPETSIADSSASAAISPPTRASPCIFHSGRRCLSSVTSISS